MTGCGALEHPVQTSINFPRKQPASHIPATASSSVQGQLSQWPPWHTQRAGAHQEPGVRMRAQGKVVDAEEDAHGVVRVEQQQQLGPPRRRWRAAPAGSGPAGITMQQCCHSFAQANVRWVPVCPCRPTGINRLHAVEGPAIPPSRTAQQSAPDSTLVAKLSLMSLEGLRGMHMGDHDEHLHVAKKGGEQRPVLLDIVGQPAVCARRAESAEE